MGEKPMSVRGVRFPWMDHAIDNRFSNSTEPTASEKASSGPSRLSSGEAYTIHLSPISLRFQEIYTRLQDVDDPVERDQRLSLVQKAAARFAETGDESLIEPFLREPASGTTRTEQEDSSTFLQDLAQAGFEMTRWLANHEGLPEAEQPLHAEASEALLSHAGEMEQRKETFNDFVRFVSSFLPVSETPSSDREQLSRTLQDMIASPTLEDTSRLLRDTRGEGPYPEG